MIVGLGFQAQVGKDSVGNFMCRKYGFQKFAFADALREMAKAVNPMITHSWPSHYKAVLESVGYEAMKASYPESREFLQRLGVAVRDILGEDTWVRPVMSKVGDVDNAVITDVRFPNEFKALKDLGAVMVEIRRPGYGGVNDHISETALAGALWDFVLLNDGSKFELYQNVDTLLTTLLAANGGGNLPPT